MSEHLEESIPAGSIVLVTGANGYIGAHVVDEILQQGFVVRGVTRSEQKGRGLQEHFQKKYGENKYQPAIVEDIEAEGAYFNVIQGVSGVIHLASPVKMDLSSKQTVDAAVNGTLNIIRAAAMTPSVSSVVITSSISACTFTSPSTPKPVDSMTWNDMAYDMLVEQGFPEKTNLAYPASKVRAERMAWKLYEATNPAFKLNTIIPAANLGRPVDYPGAQATASSAWIYDLFKGVRDALDFYPSVYFVHVRDNARLHVRALVDRTIKSERIWAASRVFTWPEVLRILKEQNPGVKLPEYNKESRPDLTQVDNRRGELLLKGWTNLADTLKEMGTSFP